jgi:hypothetical protein
MQFVMLTRRTNGEALHVNPLQVAMMVEDAVGAIIWISGQHIPLREKMPGALALIQQQLHKI